jgi:hypothetical protein
MSELPGLKPGADPGPSTAVHRSRLAWLVTLSCILALFGLAVTIVHLVWPSPLMFAMFMTVGQGSFGIAMALYLVAIIADLKRSKVL